MPILASSQDVRESINRDFKLVELSKSCKDFQIYFEEEE